MTRFDFLWWIGWVWCIAWSLLPFALLQRFGIVVALAGTALLAPWTALVGLAGVQRLLPTVRPGTYRLFSDPESVRWAMRTWAPSVYLTLFQPLFFTCEGFQRLVLRAFGARLGDGALVTSRTVVRQPDQLTLGAGALIGEYVHLVFAFQPRLKVLVTGPIEIGAGSLVGAHSVLSPGTWIGADCLLEYRVAVGPGTRIEDGARIGTGTTVLGDVTIRTGARIGKGCLVHAGAVVAQDARIPDGTIVGRTPALIPRAG